MRRHISRQQETWSVVLLALVAVLLYAAWGATVLRGEKQAVSSPASSSLSVNR